MRTVNVAVIEYILVSIEVELDIMKRRERLKKKRKVGWIISIKYVPVGYLLVSVIINKSTIKA
jgi:hypothetical protein